MLPAQLEWNAVAILESLGAGDLSTGRMLERALSERAVGAAGVQVQRRTAANRAELHARLGALAEACRGGLRPALHLEFHGSPAGLQIGGAGEVVPWEELKQDFVAINRATRCQLVVTLSVCSGAHIIRLIEATERAPFWGIVGAEGVVLAVQAYEYFREFYEDLRLGRDSARAHAKAQREAAASAEQFVGVSARHIFVEAFKRMLSRAQDARTLETRAQDMARAVVERVARPVDHDRVLRRARAALGADGLKAKFEELREEFFMGDICPPAMRANWPTWEDVSAGP